MITIEVDEEVYSYLQSNAKPFEETTPNAVLRRLLGINKNASNPITTPIAGKRPKKLRDKEWGIKNPRFSETPFESTLHDRLRNIYAVLYFMQHDHDYSHSVKQALKHFPNVKDYQTISDSCTRRFAGNVASFCDWYNSGSISNKLVEKFHLSEHDYKVFFDLLNTNK